jgi:hypothetical protein
MVQRNATAVDVRGVGRFQTSLYLAAQSSMAWPP